MEKDKSITEQIPASIREKLSVYIIMILIIALDQWSKWIIETNLPLYHAWTPFPSISHLFQITHATNTGAAFGMFPNGGNLFIIVAIFVVGMIALYNHQLPSKNHLFRLALGLQLGGALGNVIDRMRIGHVTDFLDFGPWPIFNVADTAIVTGVCILLWLMWQEYRQELNLKQQQLNNNPD